MFKGVEETGLRTLAVLKRDCTSARANTLVENIKAVLKYTFYDF